MGTKFGDKKYPLLLSVRSGARSSMPELDYFLGVLFILNSIFVLIPAVAKKLPVKLVGTKPPLKAGINGPVVCNMAMINLQLHMHRLHQIYQR